MIDRDLLDILACPACRAELREEGDRLVCSACGLRYPVRDGIPILLVDEAERPDSVPPAEAGPGRS
jgi:uncharacterized protein YbaR (Trm112 family)